MSSSVTLEQAQAQLDAWLAASMALATAQSYTFQDGPNVRTVTRANLKEVMEWVKYWQRVVDRLSNTTPRARYGVFGS